MKTKNLTNLTLSLATLLTLTATTVNAENLIQNGSFENYTVLKEKVKWKKVQLDGWGDEGKISMNSRGLLATDGNAKLVLDWNKNLNALSQTVSTIEGVSYDFSLDAYSPRKNISSANIEILVDDTLIATFNPTREWTEYNTTFVGIGGEQVIRIQESASQNNRRGALLDNVRLLRQGDVIADVLASGDVLSTSVSEEELIQATLDEIATLKQGNALLQQLYKDEAIAYDPGRRSQLINVTGDRQKIFPILYGNNNRTLAAAGHKLNSRFAAFGTAPMEYFQEGRNLSYEPQFKRLLSWLISSDTEESVENKTIGLSFTRSDKSDIKAWIASNYPSWTIKDCDRDNPDFATCYAGVDLIITGWQTNESNTQMVKSELTQQLNAGTPILYLHTWYEVTNSVAHGIADILDFSLSYAGNYWAKDKATWSGIEEMQSTLVSKFGYESMDTMFRHFKNEDYAFDWSQCSGSRCSNVPNLTTDFQTGASAVRNMINSLDNNKKDIFANDGYRLQKLLALTADKFRQSVSYPMDKVSTNDTEFMKSYYADHAVYTYRSINPKQLDMGNFSRSDFSHITPTTREVQVTSKKSFRSTGAYALPGQTVSVTRNDSSDLTVKVFINTLRSGATHQYERNDYNRPKYLQTPHFEIKSGETITFTSPYGGPLQLEFSKNDLPVDVTFSNVGEHAYWASTADNTSFAQKLIANEYEWAEVATAGFEVHSKLDKMITSVSDVQWGGTVEGLAEAIVKYTSNYPHVLAGLQGEGVDVVPEIHDWADSKGLTIETITGMKHMNADQSLCGSGCAGNPYDANWAFRPIGHGDLHEFGHGLEKKRFEGVDSHSGTNTFAYYTKSRYFANTGGEPGCQSLPFKSIFDTVQSSVGESNIEAFLKTNLWDRASWRQPYVLKINAMMHAQTLGKLENGWHVLARVNILEREMRRAKQDWEARKASVGFSTYSLDEINSIRDNDWLMIAYSYAAEVDYRNYFTMMGMPHSAKAYEQIATFGFDVAPNSLFVSTGNGYCKTDEYGTIFDRPTLSVDGSTVYSY